MGVVSFAPAETPVVDSEMKPVPASGQLPPMPPRSTKRKEFLEFSAAPMRIQSIKFGIMSAEEIARAAHIEVNNRDFYDQPDRSQTRGGALDARLGAIDKRSTCETCKENLADCTGHFGYIRLCLPVFHVGYFKATLQILQMVCKYCSRVLLDPSLRARYVNLLRNPRVSAKSVCIAPVLVICQMISLLCDCIHQADVTLFPLCTLPRVACKRVASA